MTTRDLCEWCAAPAVPGSTCPWSIECPTCQAPPGRRCVRPSEHPAAKMHAARYQTTEALDAAAGIDYTREETPTMTNQPTTVRVDELVDIASIAARLKVERATVDRWRLRGVMPDPLETSTASPVWAWPIVEAWARDTGRLVLVPATDPTTEAGHR